MQHLGRTLAALLISLSLTACTSGGDPEPQPIRINFVAETNDTVVNCTNTLTDLGTSAANASLRDLRFYIHDIVLRDIAGTRYPFTPNDNDFQSNGVVLVDFTNLTPECSAGGVAKPEHTEVVGTVPSYTGVVYTGMDFKIGVPESLNHNDPASADSPLDTATGLNIDRTQGYRFLRLKLEVENTGEWTFDLSSTNCSGDPDTNVDCDKNNRPQVRLNASNILDREIALNISELLADIDLESDVNSGCDSNTGDPECSSLLSKLALNASGNPINNASPTVFSAN